MSVTTHEMYCLADELREFAASLVSKGIVEYVGERKARLTLGSTLRIDGQYFIVDRSGEEVIAMNYYTDDNGDQKVAAALNFVSLYDPYDKQPIKLSTGEAVYWGQDRYVVVKKVESQLGIDVGMNLLSVYAVAGDLLAQFVIRADDTKSQVELAFNSGESK